MGRPFSDISLYCWTPHTVGSPEYNEETAITNYISDYYVICMHGYKPPNTTRISLQASPEKKWDRSWKDGSLIIVANNFFYDKYSALDLNGKFQYILDIIQETVIKLCEEYNWDKTVFEKAYNEVVFNNFKFKLEYPIKASKDRKKRANIYLTKTPTITTANISFVTDEGNLSIRLFDKKNWWQYDSVYKIAKGSKWFDNDKFGLFYKLLNLKVWYSLKENQVLFEKDGIQITELNMRDVFKL